MSTADSQIFALGTELQSLFEGGEEAAMRKTQMAVWGFGIAALIFSIVASDELVLLARVGFAGTALLAPMVISSVLSKRPPGPEVVVATGVVLAVFLASELGVLASKFLGVRMDLLLLLTVAAITVGSLLYRRNTEAVAAPK